jgi:hypothetical protein
MLALTPVAVLMFRFNNPDALLVLLLTLSAYALVKAMEAGRASWLVAAAALIGLGFLTKMMQAFLVVPGFALAYLVAAPVTLRRRIGQLSLAGVALVVSSGWWVAIVELWPAADRPYVGGSQTNSILELIFGYNGFGRLTGNEIGSVGGGGGPGGPGGGGMFGGGASQLFDWAMGSQIAWLLPAALLFFLTLLWLGRRMPRTDRLRASMLLWGGWLLVTGTVLSYAQGIIHPYYHHPPLLHGGAGPGTRRAGRDRCGDPVATTFRAAGAGGARGRVDRHRDVGLRAARPRTELATLAAGGRADRRPGVCGRAGCASADPPQGRRRSGCRRDSARAGRTGRLRPGHRGNSASRSDPFGRTTGRRLRGPRSWW